LRSRRKRINGGKVRIKSRRKRINGGKVRIKLGGIKRKTGKVTKERKVKNLLIAKPGKKKKKNR